MLARRRCWAAGSSRLAGDQDLPNAGDEVGPYFLRRELGRGSFARVFLAEQVNLENRLVVVKVATRPTREPWLLARVRHTHIVEIVSHALVEDWWLSFDLHAVLGGRNSVGRPGCQTRTRAGRLGARLACRPRRRRRARVSRAQARAAGPRDPGGLYRTTRRSPGSVPGWPRRSTMPSAATLPTATSSLRTSCFRRMATRGCSTSTSPANSSRGRLVRARQRPGRDARLHGPGASSGLRVESGFERLTGRARRSLAHWRPD